MGLPQVRSFLLQIKPEKQTIPGIFSPVLQHHQKQNLTSLRSHQQPLHPQRHPSLPIFHTTRTMADDASYSAFLDKANQPTSSSSSDKPSTSNNRSKFDPTSTTSSTQSAPPTISKLLSQSSGPPTYTSETDAAFEPFFASYSGSSLPSAKQFREAIDETDGQVEELKVKDFDPRGDYTEVVRAVEGAGEGGVKVFRLEVSSTRVVYFVVTLARKEEGGKLVGVKVESVES